MSLVMMGALVLGGTIYNVSAASSESGIGKISLTTTTAKAITTISTASAPSAGFTGSAKITATAKNGKTATNTVVSGASKTTSKVTYSETSNSKFKKAKSEHKEYYMGSVLSTFTKTLNLSL